MESIYGAGFRRMCHGYKTVESVCVVCSVTYHAWRWLWCLQVIRFSSCTDCISIVIIVISWHCTSLETSSRDIRRSDTWLLWEEVSQILQRYFILCHLKNWHVHSPDGSTFLRKMTSLPPSGKYNISEIPLRRFMHIYVKNDCAEFHPDLIWRCLVLASYLIQTSVDYYWSFFCKLITSLMP